MSTNNSITNSGVTVKGNAVLDKEKFSIMVSSQQHAGKTQAVAGVRVDTRIGGDGSYAVDATLEDMMQYVKQGRTIHPSVHMGKYTINNDTWCAQNTFFLDIDNKDDVTKVRVADEYYATIDEAVQMAHLASIVPVFVYTSFNHSPEWNRFRMVFRLDRTLTNKDERDLLITKLASVFTKNGQCIADTKCLDRRRCFYGGRDILHLNADAVVPVDVLSTLPALVTVDVAPTGTVSRDSFTTATGYQGVTTEHYKAMVAGNATELHRLITFNHSYNNMKEEILNSYSCTVTTSEQSLFTFIRESIPLHVLLGMPYGDTVRCILPHHEDKAPSANVFRGQVNKDGSRAYLYNCYGCVNPEQGHGIDTLTFVMKATGYSIARAIEFIETALGIELQTPYQRSMRRRLDHTKLYMEGEFQRKHKELYGKLVQKGLWGVLMFDIEQARLLMNTFPLTGNANEATFFLSGEKSALKLSAMGVRGCSTRQQVLKKRRELCAIGLEIKADTLDERAEAGARKIQDEHGFRYRTDYIIIPEYTEELLTQALADMLVNDAEGGRKAYQSRKQKVANMDEELADRMFTQDAGTGLSDYDDKFIKVATHELKKLICEYDHATEQMLIDIMKKKYGYNNNDKPYQIATKYGVTTAYPDTTQRLVGCFRERIVADANCQIVRLSKGIRVAHSIPESIASKSKVIIPMDATDEIEE